MHRDTPVYSELSPMGWTKTKHKDVCRECGGGIAKGDPAWHVGAYACCQLCFTAEIPEQHPIIVGTRGPSADWVWRPSKSQAYEGWTAERMVRADGTPLEWTDRLDLGPLTH